MADATATVSDRDLSDLYSFRAIGASPAEVSKKLADLEKDNQKERDKVRDLTEKLRAVPAEGSVVIPPGEEATEYAAWKALEVKPEDVAKLKTDNATLAAEKAKRDRRDALEAARETEGWNDKAPNLLMALAGFDALEMTQGEVTVEKTANGKKESVKSKTALVTVDGKPVRVSEWAKEAHPDIAPLLTVNAEGGGEAAGGRAVSEQRGNPGTATVTGGIDEMIAANRSAASAGNPLKPAKAAA